MEYTELERAALKLDRGQRSRLAQRLVRSLEDIAEPKVDEEKPLQLRVTRQTPVVPDDMTIGEAFNRLRDALERELG